MALLWAPGGDRAPSQPQACWPHPLQEPFHIYCLPHLPDNCEGNPQILVVSQELKAQELPQGSNLALQD